MVMGDDEYRAAAHQLIDYILNYQSTVRQRPVLPDVKAGYLSTLVPSHAPDHPESWDAVMQDIERVIVPGMTQWHSPGFHAYYPVGNSHPGMLGEILAHGLSCVGLTWEASPACLELEVAVMDWLAKMLQLPEHFLSSSGEGGGVIIGSATEAVVLTLTAARSEALQTAERSPTDQEATTSKTLEKHEDHTTAEENNQQEGSMRQEIATSEGYMMSSGTTASPEVMPTKGVERLVAFTSAEANPAILKAAGMALVRMRKLKTDSKCVLQGETLRAAILEELELGNLPIYMAATLGTTGTCAFDNLVEIAAVCKEFNIWLHVDAAYAGAAFACPEYRHLMAGIEDVTSFSFNTHKWMLVNFECAPLWVRDSSIFSKAHKIDAQVLETSETKLPNFRNWSLALGRRFRALKLWFVLRLYGISGIQKYIRGHVRLARHFEGLVRKDPRFEVASPASMGVVCFRVAGRGNTATERLMKRVTEAKNVFMVSTKLPGDVLVARFVVVSRVTTTEDIETSWKEIQRHVDGLQEVALPSNKVITNAAHVDLAQPCTSSQLPRTKNTSSSDVQGTACAPTCRSAQVKTDKSSLHQPADWASEMLEAPPPSPYSLASQHDLHHQEEQDHLWDVTDCHRQQNPAQIRRSSVSRPPVLRTKSGRLITFTEALMLDELGFDRGM